MAEPRFLEFLVSVSSLLSQEEPNLSVVRGKVAAALLLELNREEHGANDTPGVPEVPHGMGVTGVSGVPAAAGGRDGVAGVSGVRAAAGGRDGPRLPRGGPQLTKEELVQEIGFAINHRGLKFCQIHDTLVKATDMQRRQNRVTDRILLGYESLSSVEQMQVQDWWREESRNLPEPDQDREGRVRSRSSPRSGARDRSQSAAAPSSSGANGRRSSGAEGVHGVRGVRGDHGAGPRPSQTPAQAQARVMGPPSTVTIYSMPSSHQGAFRNKVEAHLDLWAYGLLQSGKTKHLGYHNGTHPEILACAAGCPGTVLLVRELRAWLERVGVWVPGVPGVAGHPAKVGTRLWGVRVSCNHGRHRSVAGAELLGWLLRRKGITTEIVHCALEPSKDRPKAHDHELRDPPCEDCGFRPTEEDLDRLEFAWED